MQYSKYALALVFMASSAFAVTLPDFRSISQELLSSQIKKDFLRDHVNFVTNDEDFFSKLKSDSISNLKSKSNLNSNFGLYFEVFEALQQCYYDFTVDEIYKNLVKEKQIKDKVYADIQKLNLIDEDNFNEIKTYVEFASKELTKDEIKSLIKNYSLPKIPVKDRVEGIKKLSGSGLLRNIVDFKGLATEDQIELMKLEEKNLGKKLDDAELEKILNFEDSAIEDRIKTLKGGILAQTAEKIKKALEKIPKYADIDLKTVNGFGLSPEQFFALMSKNPSKGSAEIEYILSNPEKFRPDENEFFDILVKYILHLAPMDDDRVGDLPNLEYLVRNEKEKVDAIKYQEELTGKKINSDILKKIVFAKDAELAEFARPPEKPDDFIVPEELRAKVDKILKLADAEGKLSTVPDGQFTDLTKEQITAIKDKARGSDKKITAREIVEILNANAPSAPPPVITPKPGEKPGENQTHNQPGANVDIPAEIMKQVDKNGKFKPGYRKALNTVNIKISPEQWGQLEAAGKAKKLTLALVKEIMTAKPDAKPENTKDEKDENDRVDLVMKYIDENGKLKAGAKQAFKAAGIAKDQIKKLMAADTLDKDKVAEILASSVTKSDDTGSGTKSDDTPFYMSGWFITISAVLAVGAIGGGVYMMTRKSEETDL